MEVLRDQLDPVAWAQALVESQGSRDEALSCYARVRLSSLTEEETEQSGKKTNLEERRRESFRDFESVPVLPPGDVEERSLISLVDALFWHVVAMVGMMGCVLAAGLLWPVLKLNFSWQVLIVVVMSLQVIPVAGWWAGRGGARAVSYAQAVQMAGCLAMIGSLVLGCSMLFESSLEESPGFVQGPPMNEQNLVLEREALKGVSTGDVESAAPRTLVTTDPD